MSDYRIVRSDELYHHGIKGMKWGVRRFQNEDGTLTEAGQKRYARKLGRSHSGEAKYAVAKKIADNYATEGQLKQLNDAYSNLQKIQIQTKAARDEFFAKAQKIYKDRVRKERINEDTDGDRVYDECLYEAKAKYPKLHAAVKKEADAYNNLSRIQQDVGKQIMGKYADTKVSLTETYASIVGSAIFDRVYNSMQDEHHKYW